MEARKSKLPYIPDDVIREILVRSPLKSIGRFRCLSKLFCSLLSDSKFAKNQLELTLRRRSNVVHSDNHSLLLTSSLPKLILVDLDSMDMEREYSVKEALILSSKRKNIIGSSNGLVCIRCEEEDVLLYNPVTRDSKIIPKLPESLHHQLSCSYEFGFGFDALTNDYKVVKLISCKENDEHNNKYTVCYVYSLKSDSWKRINNLLPYYYKCVNDSNAYLKGTIHWIVTTEGVEDQEVLIASDLERDELREMTLPNWAEEFDFDVRNFAVDTLKGCLCVVHDGSFEMHKSIWVMKEYGIESSWSKIGINLSEYSIKLLGRNKNGEELLYVFNGNFVFAMLETPAKEFYTKMKVSMYVESLISPNS